MTAADTFLPMDAYETFSVPLADDFHDDVRGGLDFDWSDWDARR